MTAAEAFVKLSLDDTGLQRGLARAQKRLSAFGASVSAIGRSFLTFGVISAAGLGFTIKAASGMEETMNKFNVVFDKNSKVVKQWSDDYADSVGRSKKQIADFMAGSQDLFVPLGFDADNATELSKIITGLSVDMASFNNLADADTLRDLHAALTGSGEVMKKYGVVVDEATVKQELLNQGFDPKNATNQQKVQARLAIILKGTTAAQGDAIRSAGSWANQQKRAIAELENTAVVIGNNLLPVLTPLLTKVGNAIRGFGDWAKSNRELAVFIMQAVAGILAFGVAMVALGAVTKGTAAAFGLLNGALVVFGIVMKAAISLPGLMVIAFAAVITAGLALMGVFDNMFAHFSTAWNAIKTAIESGNIAGAFKVLGATLAVIWRQLVFNLASIWDKLVTKLALAVRPLRKTFYDMAEPFMIIYYKIKEYFQKMLALFDYWDQRFKDWIKLKLGRIDQFTYDSWGELQTESRNQKYKRAENEAESDMEKSVASFRNKKNESESDYILRIGQESADRMKPYYDALKKSTDELKASVKEVEKTRALEGSKALQNAQKQLPGSQAQIQAMSRGTAVGSFRAADLRYMAPGAGSTAERSLKVSEEISKNTRKSNDLLEDIKDGGLAFT